MKTIIIIAMLMASVMSMDLRLLYMSIPESTVTDTVGRNGIIGKKITCSFKYTCLTKRSDTTKYIALHIHIKQLLDTIETARAYFKHVGKGYWLVEDSVDNLDVSRGNGGIYMYLSASTLWRRIYGDPFSGPLDSSNTIKENINPYCDGLPSYDCGQVYIGTSADSLGWKPNPPATESEVDPELTAQDKPEGVESIYTISGKKVHGTDLTKVPVGVYVVMPVKGKPYVRRVVK